MSGKTPINRLESDVWAFTCAKRKKKRERQGNKNSGAENRSKMSSSSFVAQTLYRLLHSTLIHLSLQIGPTCRESHEWTEQGKKQRKLGDLFLFKSFYIIHIFTLIHRYGPTQRKRDNWRGRGGGAISCFCGLDNGARWANKGVAQYLRGNSPSLNKHQLSARSVSIIWLCFSYLFEGFCPLNSHFQSRHWWKRFTVFRSGTLKLFCFKSEEQVICVGFTISPHLKWSTSAVETPFCV